MYFVKDQIFSLVEEQEKFFILWKKLDNQITTNLYYPVPHEGDWPHLPCPGTRGVWPALSRLLTQESQNMEKRVCIVGLR